MIPFLPKDLYGITGLGGSSDLVSISLKTSINILLSHLSSFILQRKIQESSASFNISDFFEFLYSSLRNIIIFTYEDKKLIQKKIVLFFNHVCKLAKTNNINLIEKVEDNWDEFLIKVKKTSTLSARITDIEADLFKIIDAERKQMKIKDFL